MTPAQRLAAALHAECIAEWHEIAERDPGRLLTQHLADAHLGRAAAILTADPTLVCAHPSADPAPSSTSVAPERLPFERCPICESPNVVRLSADWREGMPIAIIGCGNPWHYEGLGDPACAHDPASVAAGEALERLTETALARFDQHGRWTGAMATINRTYGGGWYVGIEYPEADYGNHLGSRIANTLPAAVDAAIAEAEATFAAALAEGGSDK